MNKKLFKICGCAVLSGIIALSSSVSMSAAVQDHSLEPIVSIKAKDGKLITVRNNDIVPDKNKSVRRKNAGEALPSKFSLVELGQSTSVKNQDYYGNCWTFGAMAAMESNLIKSGNADKNIDLSEKQLTWFNYNGADSNSDKSLFAGKDTFVNFFDYDPYQFGGNIYMSSATLMRRYGAIDDKKLPLYFDDRDYNIDSSFRTQSDIYLKNTYFLESTNYMEYDENLDVISQDILDEPEFTDNLNNIKRKMMEYGAVDASFYASDSIMEYDDADSYWNENTNSYYFDASYKEDDFDNGFRGANHEINIVGWDDNYSKDNFKIKPPKNGAWIMKNTWGSDWGNNGYFYISYYDKSICDFTIFEAENAEYKTDGTTKHEYKNIYQYDGAGIGLTQIFDAEGYEVKAANYFTARNEEALEAISTISAIPDSTLNYEIYLNPDSKSDPTTGKLVSSGKYYFNECGYVTIPLNYPVNLQKGDVYAVVISIEFDFEGQTYYVLPCEITDESDFYVSLDVNDGESAIYYNNEWNAIYKGYDYFGIKLGNAVVKAYTSDGHTDVFGDVNLDGRTSILDATEIQKHLVALAQLSPEQIKIADVNNDGRVSILDATKIQKYLVGLN